jgi:hypothetical protein
MKIPAKRLVLLLLFGGMFGGMFGGTFRGMFGGMAFSRDSANSSGPKWKIDLREKFRFEAFDRPVTFRWTLNQDVIFLPPDRLLVYQVYRSAAVARLSARDASGGGGNFILDARVLSAVDGHEIKALRFPTNADASEIMSTRDGRFLVRTGDILYLYSAGFERMASRPLPLRREVREESWQIDVSPSGAEVVLVHNQVFKRDPISPTSAVEKASVDIEVLNEATLEVARKFSLPWFIAAWSAGEHALVSSNPSRVAGPAPFGLLDFDGKWSPLLSARQSPTQPCAYQARAVDARLFVTYGCGTLTVFPQNGPAVFSLKSPTREIVGSVKSGGGNLAVLVERRFTRIDAPGNIPIAMARPLRIDVFDLNTQKGILSAPLQRERVYYALTPQSALAVVDGATLALYQAGP